jgi:hypothetical protein
LFAKRSGRVVLRGGCHGNGTVTSLGPDVQCHGRKLFDSAIANPLFDDEWSFYLLHDGSKHAYVSGDGDIHSLLRRYHCLGDPNDSSDCL